MNRVYCQSGQVVKNGSKTLKSNPVLQRYLLVNNHYPRNTLEPNIRTLTDFLRASQILC